MTTMQWIYGFARKVQTNIPGAVVADAVEWDGDDILANAKSGAWRGLGANGVDSAINQDRSATLARLEARLHDAASWMQATAKATADLRAELVAARGEARHAGRHGADRQRQWAW